MKLGAFMMPVHPAAKNYVQTLREDREAVLWADELGFSEFFVGEHSTDLIENIPSSLAFIASLAYATKTIKLGTGTINLPNSHPANIAATAAMIDNMLEGRFIFGISPGGLPSDWEIFETFDKDRNAMFVECIEHILALWSATPPYDLHGRFWNLSTKRFYDADVGIGSIVKPHQSPRPEIACTALLPFSPGLEKAAARGWHPISANFLQPSAVASHWHQYDKGCRSAELSSDRKDWRIARNIFVADDEVTAKRYGRGSDGPYAFYVNQLYRKLKKAGRLNIFKNSPDDPDELITLDYVIDRLTIVGTVNSVVDKILAFRENTGDFGTLLYAMTDWVDPALSRRSMQLMAQKVMPAVNDLIAAEGLTGAVA
jgi:alkanesulfonate monooxygenase SsuD/methylene tetrahydromethanopterin reductase-like flavin-dependent oxidoreductase (luciferase family)